jgi:hypothetical protein
MPDGSMHKDKTRQYGFKLPTFGMWDGYEQAMSYIYIVAR